MRAGGHFADCQTAKWKMVMRNRRVKATLRRTDNLTPKERRKAMRAVRGRDTAPERRVAAALRAMGIRFRYQGDDLPGRPDFVLPTLRAVLLVQGCFWHGHGCRSRTPQTNRGYWVRKLMRNRRRDRRVRRALNKRGWTVLLLWECRVATPRHAAQAVRGAVARALSARAVARRSARRRPRSR